MRCEPCREALSARLDGEDPGVAPDLVERHLATCTACTAFAEGSGLLRRRLAVRPADAVPDLTGPILDAAPTFAPPSPVVTPVAARTAATSHWTRWALLGVALTQLAISVPPMILGHDAGAPIHVARELGSWYLALSAALLLVVLRPSRAQGLVPFAAALAVAMFGTAVVDVVSGGASAGAESQHLLDLAGLGLLWAIARRPVDETPLLGGLIRPRPRLAA